MAVPGVIHFLDCEASSLSADSYPARRRARDAGREVVADDVLTEIAGVAQPKSAKTLRRVAIHEAGHAVVSAVRRPGCLVSVSIQHAGGNAGTVESSLAGIGGTSEDIDGILCELLAGRAAEEVCLDLPSAGSGGTAESDLAQATVVAACAEATWGLGTGLAWRGDIDARSVGRLLSKDAEIAVRVEARLQGALGTAAAILEANRGALDLVVAALLERGALSGAEAETIIQGAMPCR